MENTITIDLDYETYKVLTYYPYTQIYTTNSLEVGVRVVDDIYGL